MSRQNDCRLIASCGIGSLKHARKLYGGHLDSLVVVSNLPVLLVLTLWVQGLDCLHHLWLVEAKVLGARDGGLGRRRERLALAAAGLDLVVDAAEDLRQEGFRGKGLTHHSCGRGSEARRV